MSASARERRHGQRVLLVDGVQLHGAHGVSDELQFLGERLAAVRHPDVGDVGAADVVADGTLQVIVGPQPVALGLEVKRSEKPSLALTSNRRRKTDPCWTFTDNTYLFNLSFFYTIIRVTSTQELGSELQKRIRTRKRKRNYYFFLFFWV